MVAGHTGRGVCQEPALAALVCPAGGTGLQGRQTGRAECTGMAGGCHSMVGQSGTRPVGQAW